DLKLAALRHAGRRIALGEHAAAAAVRAGPGHYEVPGRVHGHGRINLGARGDAVDQEFTALWSSGGVIALRENIRSATEQDTGVLPHDHEVPGRVAGYGRNGLVPGRGSVDPKLRSEGSHAEHGPLLETLEPQPATQSVHTATRICGGR